MMDKVDIYDQMYILDQMYNINQIYISDEMYILDQICLVYIYGHLCFYNKVHKVDIRLEI